ncbi:hypothetical protein pipiens_001888 [Culex pipiens pipiens]|uniref:PX domain-containing protein n=1 Tax=Culex pipiens pipiens TaxID=38569 RepID=A0ABD1DRF7_CULPP
MKEELEAEYLATFKKTVAMHEVFLTQMTTHPVFRNDSHLKVFLEFDQDLCANLKKKIDVFGGLMRRIGKTTDEILLGTTVKYVKDFFEHELQFLGPQGTGTAHGKNNQNIQGGGQRTHPLLVGADDAVHGRTRHLVDVPGQDVGYFRKDSKHRRPRRQRPGPHARRHAPVLPATPPRPCRFVGRAASQRTRPLTGIWRIARAKNKDVYATSQMMLAQDVDGQKQQIDAAECQWK